VISTPGGVDAAGHGAYARRGRPPFSPAEQALAAAMRALLEAGGAAARSQLIDLPGGRTHFLEVGDGPHLVLVQGAGGGAANWYRVLRPLADRFHVLIPDLPGFGLSRARPVSPPVGRQGADFILEWLDALGVHRFSLVGTSLGGLIALRVALAVPDRVERLVLIDTVGLGRALPWPVRIAALPRIGRLLLRHSRGGIRWQLRHLLVSDHRPLAWTEDLLIDYLWRSALAAPAGWMAGALVAFAGPLGQREVLHDDELGRVRPPTLVIWGERDRFLPLRHARRAAALVPHAILHILPGAGHSPNWEAPAQLLHLLGPFLTGSSLAPPPLVRSPDSQ